MYYTLNEQVINGTGDMYAFGISFLIVTLITVTLMFTTEIKARYLFLMVLVLTVITPYVVLEGMYFKYKTTREVVTIEKDLQELEPKGAGHYVKVGYEGKDGFIPITFDIGEGEQEEDFKKEKVVIIEGEKPRIKIEKYEVGSNFLDKVIEEEHKYVRYVIMH